MSKLKELMSINGVVAAGEFNSDGSLAAFEGNITEEEAAMAAQVAHANKVMAQMQVDGYTAMSGEDGWTPVQGFAISGPKLSICVGGNIGVFVDNESVSFNEVFRALQS